MLRSLKQARYSPQNKGHFGLASTCYTHFTSPIRRYPDLTVHRILKADLGSDEPQAPGSEPFHGTRGKLVFSFRRQGQDSERTEPRKAKRDAGHKGQELAAAAALAEKPSLYNPDLLESIASHSSETERRADEAERELIDVKKLEFMADKLGDEFEGIIIHITKDGMFVELLDLFIEGFVKISTLDDDDYLFRDRPVCLWGRSSGRTFRLGDRLKVCVDRIDRFRKRIDFSVTEKVVSKPHL